METYGDVRRALEEHPTTWSLIEGVNDDDPLPDFPATAQDVAKEKKRGTSLKTLRRRLLKQPPADPSVLYRAVEHGVLERSEAEDILRATWGEEFTLEDFAPAGE